LDHFVRLEEEQRWHRDPEGLGRLEVDDQLKLHGLLDGQVRGLCAPENLVDIDGAAPKKILVIRAVTYQAAGLHMIPQREHRWQPVP
jgi:hypothetical protein